MASKMELTAEADRELAKLDARHSRRIFKFLHQWLSK
jgi:mRNA-degrading endonuclease RelE of RelBE toxin-antitoxin system